MLVLTRRKEETIVIGDTIEITVLGIRGDQVRLGIAAPPDIPVHRKEVYDSLARENRSAMGRPGALRSILKIFGGGSKQAHRTPPGRRREPRAENADNSSSGEGNRMADSNGPSPRRSPSGRNGPNQRGRGPRRPDANGRQRRG